jgi:hypothetical protein
MGAAVAAIVKNKIKAKIGEKAGGKNQFGFAGGLFNKKLEDTAEKVEGVKSLATDPMQFVKDRLDDRIAEKRERIDGILNPRRTIKNQLMEQGFPEDAIDSVLSTMSIRRDDEEIPTPGVSRGIL